VCDSVSPNSNSGGAYQLHSVTSTLGVSQALGSRACMEYWFAELEPCFGM